MNVGKTAWRSLKRMLATPQKSEKMRGKSNKKEKKKKKKKKEFETERECA